MKYGQPIAGTMAAANLHGVGALSYERLPIPNCGEGEVLVKVKNCGVCGSDIDRVLKRGTYHFPTVPGHEFAGQVVYDPSGEWAGKRVAVFPLLPCFRCEHCRTGHYAQCTDYDYYGSRRDGGFAEYIAVKKFNLIELPEKVSYEEGALCEPASVALHAVRQLKVGAGDRVLVIGAVPIGLLSAMWAQSMGAGAVYLTDIDARKLDFCRELGLVVYNGETVDAVLEGSGASGGLRTAIRGVKTFGRIALLGNPGGEMRLEPSDYQLILRKELGLTGVWNSVYSERENNWQESLQAIADGLLPAGKLITHRVALRDCAAAIRMMKERSEFYCKVMAENEK